MRNVKDFFKNKINANILTAVLCVGAVLMAAGGFMPEKNKEQPPAVSETEKISDYEDDFEERLEKILSHIDGAGKVEIMIAYESGKELIVKEDKSSQTTKKNDESEEKNESKTVMANDEPFVIKEMTPNIKGIIIVAQGGGNIETKEKLINAAKALTGVEAHKIEVLKMKTGGN